MPHLGGRRRHCAKDGAQLSFFPWKRTQSDLKTVQAQSDYGPALCVLGVIDAALGRKEEALREGRRAVELLPMEKDPIRSENRPGSVRLRPGTVRAWSNRCRTWAEGGGIARRTARS